MSGPFVEMDMVVGSFFEAIERLKQQARDDQPCPSCGGDRLRQDFTGSGRCHAPRREDRK